MIYRELGKTGKQVGVIGLGCEHLDRTSYEQVKETIDVALDHGVNILDVFMPGREVRERIAKALGGRRDRVLVQGHIGATDVNQLYDISRDLPTVRRYFEDMLRIFGGRIDLGMMFFIDSEKDYSGVFDTGFADYVAKLKQQGDIGHIGFSSHNPATAMRVLDTGLPELMMFSINPAFDLCPADMYALDTLEDGMDASLFRGLDPERAALYTRCEQLGVGITVMKTLGAGKLLSPEHTPFEKPMTACQCIHYALTRPAVASALVGCKSGAEMLGTLRYLDAGEAERDYAPALGALRNDFRGHCVYCSHCQPCPAAIDIAAVNKYLDIARLDTANIPPSIRAHYASLPHGGGECVACGQCEERCPFGVPVIANMAEAEGLLG
ncbi:MAG: aldo/keto reductase [Clostridia bacterium]|nr:aldo/keto reductase [Clostridia bacterium]